VSVSTRFKLVTESIEIAITTVTTRNQLTHDPPYWSLDGHYFPFMTFL
jgi:hypothetical protein